jgi:hypothetical protein
MQPAFSQSQSSQPKHSRHFSRSDPFPSTDLAAVSLTFLQQLIAAEAAASKALPQWATALIVIFALIAVVATIVVGFFLKRARNALEVCNEFL